MGTRHSFTRIALHATVGLVVLFALYAAAVGLVLPPLARGIAMQRLGEALHRNVSIERVRLNPFTLAGSVEGVKVFEADGKAVFVGFDALDLQASLASLRHLAPVVDSAVLRGLRVNAVRDGDAHYNFSDLVERLTAPAKDAAPSRPLRFSFSNIHIAGGTVDFNDLPKAKHHQVTDLDLRIPFISSLPVHAKEMVKPSFAARVNGAPVKIEGDVLPFEASHATHFTLRVNGIDLPRYAPYSPVPLPLAIDSGVLDAQVTVRFETSGSQPAFQVDGKATLVDLAGSTASERPWAKARRIEIELARYRPLAGTLSVPSVRIEDLDAAAQPLRLASTEARGIDVDLRRRTIHAAALEMAGGQARLERSNDGSLRLASLPLPGAPEASSPWHVALDKLTVTDFGLELADHGVRPAVQHRARVVSLEATDVVNDHGFAGRATMKLALARGGEAQVASTFTLEPLAVEARIDARNVDLVPLRAYVAQFPTLAIASGRASAQGLLRIAQRERALAIDYTGAARVNDLKTVETGSGEDLLDWKSIEARNIRFEWARRMRLAAGDVRVDHAYSRLIVHPDGKLNVQALRGESGPRPASATSEPTHDIRIDRIRFVDSRLNFTDHYVKPNYSADVGELAGTVTGLSSDPQSRGTLDLRGRYDHTSPVLIEGTINPLAPELFADVTAKGTDIELPKLSAYSQRYAGYGISAGKLDLDVRYHIENGKLEGRNKILLEQLTFGEKVESPDAIKVPILFAVNLLKDKDGRIDLELPVSGSLDDPQFEISGLIGQVVSNLLQKAISRPFEFLSAVFSGGGGGDSGSGGSANAKPDDLAYVDFAPGIADLDAQGRGKLEKLAKLLGERPGLRLEVASRLDEPREERAWRFAQLRRIVADAKRRALGVQGDVTVDDAEYPKFVRSAYADAKLPPGDFSVATMETRLLDRITVDDGILHKLAEDRARRVMGYLTSDEHVAADRVALASANASDTPAGEASRVVFALR